jgi:hypothetical protein
MQRLEQLNKTNSGKKTIHGVDADGEPVAIDVLIVKLTDDDMEDVIARSKAARARAAVRRNDPDSVEYGMALDVVLTVCGDNKTALAYFVASNDLNRQLVSVQAKVADRDHWKEDGYLDGLLEALTDDVLLTAEAARVEMPGVDLEDPETRKAIEIVEAVDRYNAEVREDFELVVADELSTYEGYTVEELTHKATLAQVSITAELAAKKEGDRCLVWRSTRVYQPLPDTVTADRPDGIPDVNAPLYWAKRPDVDLVADSIRNQILDLVAEIEVSPLEGKGLPAPAGSSTESDSPSGSGATPSSSPTAATV